jgi:hypothetical protein
MGLELIEAPDLESLGIVLEARLANSIFAFSASVLRAASLADSFGLRSLG